MCTHFIAMVSARCCVLSLLLNPPSKGGFMPLFVWSVLENVAHLDPLHELHLDLSC